MSLKLGQHPKSSRQRSKIDPQHRHICAAGESWGMRRADDEGVRVGQRGEQRAVLVGERGHGCEGAGNRFEARAHVVLAGAVGFKIRREDSGDLVEVRRRFAEQGCHQRVEEDARGDEGGDRVAGEAQHALLTKAAEQHGLAGPHGDVPEVERHAEAFECRAHEIVVANGSSTGGDQNVGVVALGEAGCRIVERVAGDPEHDGFAPVGAHHRGKTRGVGGHDLAGAKWGSRRHEFVAGRQDRNRRAAADGERAVACRCGKGDGAGVECAAGCEERLAKREIATSRADVGAVGRALTPLLLCSPWIGALLPPLILLLAVLGVVGHSALLWAAIATGANLIWWLGAYAWLRLSPIYALLHPLGAAVMLYVSLRAIARGSNVRWKDREYVSA